MHKAILMMLLAVVSSSAMAEWVRVGSNETDTLGNFLVHISKLSGKEFYDAVVSIDKISAVRIKMRDK